MFISFVYFCFYYCFCFCTIDNYKVYNQSQRLKYTIISSCIFTIVGVLTTSNCFGMIYTVIKRPLHVLHFLQVSIESNKTFSFDHCVVCSSSIYRFWLPLWYLQTLLACPQNSRNSIRVVPPLIRPVSPKATSLIRPDFRCTKIVKNY
jgi:hypothetical protein